ncbi:hypothetical protein [Pseudomonas eucalypticola]|uniref:Uncharacterized protein n=1 Tax=Pseudomonas eucalypticola TaxID=2599595 RepID=A0A7D5D730_9PSED|nr:hypothetical protein [Pseudomonas eucalypticola]QKZ04372.1 hypothetical protein HWQ56_11465 [Pseudomonas eucalypticola]
MIKAIKQVNDALDQQMELNFFLANQLIQLSPAHERDPLKQQLHARLSALREHTLMAASTLDALKERPALARSGGLTRLKRWITRY